MNTKECVPVNMLRRSKYSHFAMQFEARCRHPTITCERLTKVKKKSASSAVVYKFQAAQSLKAMSMSGSLIENDSRSCTLASIATHRGLRLGSFWFIVGRPALGSVWLASDLSSAMLLFHVNQPPAFVARVNMPVMHWPDGSMKRSPPFLTRQPYHTAAVGPCW